MGPGVEGKGEEGGKGERETKVWSCPLSTRLDDIVKKFKWSPKHIFSQIMMREFVCHCLQGELKAEQCAAVL